jgi:hypothetical protein
MRIPAVDSYLEYTAGVGGTSVNTFVHPDLTPAGMPYSPSLSELVVAVDDTVTTAYVNNGNGTITLNSNAAVGSTVKIWRVTPVLESLVTFPVPTKMDPKFNNKSITQLLLCIQEVWGGLKELNSKLDGINSDLQSYINSAIASVFEFSGLAAAVWSTTLSAGDTSLATPYSFTKGILIVGGSVYNLANPSHVTLDNTGANTVINFLSPIVADHEVILITF